jgi:peptide/nickel transport system substrate-binding protein
MKGGRIMKTTRKSGWVLLTLVVALCVAAITTFTFAAEPKAGGTLRIGVRVQQELNMDVRYLHTVTTVPAADMVYDRLFNWGEKGFASLVPNIATGYETKDNRVWIIKLRKGVKFHNGREMTAEDVKTNFDWRITTPKGWKPVKHTDLLQGMKQVDVVDRYTVRVTFEKPFSSFMRNLAWVIRGIVPPEEVEKWGDQFAFHASGTGPYKVVEVKPNEKYVLERFDGYWGPKPYINRIEYIYYRADEPRLVALEKGEIDFAQLYDESKPTLQKNAKLAFKELYDPSILHKHYFNMRRWPGNDVRFRKAVWMGADWKNIAINAYAFKSGNPARTFLEYSAYFNQDALKLVPPYNPEEAKKLIQAVEKDAGKKIPPIVWVDAAMPANQNLAEMAKAQLAQIGVPLNLMILSPALWQDKIVRDPKMDWDMGGYGLGFALDPSVGFTIFETNSGTAPDGKSLGAYSNPEFDGWIRKAEAARTEEDRTRFFQEAEKVLLKDAAAIPLWPQRYVFAWNKKLQGVKLTDVCSINVTNSWANMWFE